MPNGKKKEGPQDGNAQAQEKIEKEQTQEQVRQICPNVCQAQTQGHADMPLKRTVGMPVFY